MVNKNEQDDVMRFALIGLRWDDYQYKDSYFDMDISAFMLNENGKLTSTSDFIFYNNQKSRNDAIVHTGDSRSGGRESDDEFMVIDFSKIPDEIKKIAICVSVYDSEIRNSNFGQVSDAYVRIVKLADANDKIGTPILMFDLGNEFSVESALVVAEFCKGTGEQWDCTAVSKGVRGGLEGICLLFGADI